MSDTAPSPNPADVRIGTAGWALPAEQRDRFGEGASNLTRYATRFDCVEINSSFHRRHRAATWARWGADVPDHFQFSAKLPRTITHDARLAECDDLLAEFVADTAGLGAKLAVVLVQLPPSLAFEPAVAGRFFDRLRAGLAAQIVCEPRHPSWFGEEAGRLLVEQGIASVAADPAPVPGAALPGGDDGIAYWRLHGSPRIYRSSYEAERLEGYAGRLRGAGRAWCIFDNTASAAATANALDLVELVRPG